MEHDKNAGQLIARLRAADERTVFAALKGFYAHRPLEGADGLLEFYNRMLDEVIGAPED